MASGFNRLKGFLGAVLALVLYLVIGGTVIFLLFRGCEGDHRYMNVGQRGTGAPPGDAHALAAAPR